MFRLIEPSSGQNHSTGTFSDGIMMAQWAETCHRIFSFLILITNVCGVIDEINVLYYRKTQRDGSYQSCARNSVLTKLTTLDIVQDGGRV
jgi:hypothetical protein